MVLGYNNSGNPYEIVKNKTPNAADDLVTSIEDYGKFLVAVLNNDLLTPKIDEEMKTKHIETKKDKFFGLGFEIYDLGNEEIVLSHGGSDNGVNTIVFLLPKTKKGLIIFTNVENGYKIYEPLVNHYLGNVGKKIISIETK